MEEKPAIPKINLESKPAQGFEIKTETIPAPNIPNPNMKKWTKISLIVIVGLIVILVVAGIQSFFVYKKGMKLVSSAQKLADIAKAGNITALKEEIPSTKKELSSFKLTFNTILWMKVLPFVGKYVTDAQHGVNAAVSGLEASEILINVSEPYAKELGFAQDSAEKSTQERIDFVVNAIPSLTPKIDEVSKKVAAVQEEISKINANNYPEKYKSVEIRSKIKLAQDTITEASSFLVNAKPLLESAPYLLGMDSPRKYLVLFQNDKELRPTGGFMTAYSIMKVDKAKFEPVSSDDIYNLDAKYKSSTEAPDPIVKMIKGPYVLSKNLRLRDMNWSPDFEVSMKSVSDAVGEVGINDVDGIIAMDTQLLVNLLDVIGPIGVPGFGNFSTQVTPECNCPQVIHELESFADVEGPIIWDPVTGKIILKPANSDNRKRIIGPLMNSILANALGQPKEKLSKLFEAGFTSLMEKHVLFYIYDETVQKAVSDFGLTGKIIDYEGDYLHINDANLGGRKSNLYVTQEVSQDIVVSKDGSVEKTLTITYKNPEKYDGWLNSVLPNWVRVYVPKGSQLIAAEGLDEKPEGYEDLGKTVFAGKFDLRPEGVSKVTLKYKLPMKFKTDYQLLIQKQPGTSSPLYTITLGKHEEELLLSTDKKIKIKI